MENKLLAYAQADAKFCFEWGRQNGWHLTESLSDVLMQLPYNDRARHEQRITQILNAIESMLGQWENLDERFVVRLGVSPASVNVTALADKYYAPIINDYFEANGARYRCERVEYGDKWFSEDRKLLECWATLRPFGIEDL